MTEIEAKEKWCPLAQISYQIYSGIGRSEHQQCCGSDCMMWRYKTNRQMGYDRNPDDICITSGYCGLGGKS